MRAVKALDEMQESALRELVDGAIQSSLGMAMIYTLVEVVQVRPRMSYVTVMFNGNTH